MGAAIALAVVRIGTRDPVEPCPATEEHGPTATTATDSYVAASWPIAREIAPSGTTESEFQVLERIARLAKDLEKDPASELELIEITRSGTTAECREAAVVALRDSRSDAALDSWIRALRDPDEWVKDAAEMALFRFADRPRVCHKLEEAMLDADRAVRLAAASIADELIDGRLPWDEIYAGPARVTLNG